MLGIKYGLTISFTLSNEFLPGRGINIYYIPRTIEQPKRSRARWARPHGQVLIFIYIKIKLLLLALWRVHFKSYRRINTFINRTTS